MKGNRSKILYNRAVNVISIHHTAVIFSFHVRNDHGSATGMDGKYVWKGSSGDREILEEKSLLRI